MGVTRFGIIGLGRIGKIHFENINSFIDDASIAAVSNLNSKNQKWVKDRSDTKIYDHYDQMLVIPKLMQ